MEEVPLSDDKPPQLRVGLTYNLKKAAASDLPDCEAEYDEISTILAIQNALISNNCVVELLEATEELPLTLAQAKVDIVFNIAEGTQGRGREAQVPALCNFFHIPFTGSDETTLCIALDKALTKRILATHHIKTPKYKVIRKGSKTLGGRFPYPAIVKPNAEGSSKGITNASIVSNANELKSLLFKNLEMYRQDMLVEEFVDGREFTVGILGNSPDLRVFSPMEIVFAKKTEFNIYSFEVKRECKEYIRYDCPAALDTKTEKKMVDTAKKIYEILECKDFARIDFRMNSNDELYFIEINPLPGLAPGYSDFPMLAEKNGVGYNALVFGVLHAALKRYGLQTHL